MLDYVSNMIHTTVYLDHTLNKQIRHIALVTGISQAEVMRLLMSAAIDNVDQIEPIQKELQKHEGAQPISRLSGLIKETEGLPPDLSIHHDQYLWD